MVALYVYNFDNIFVLLTDSCIGACRDESQCEDQSSK